MKLDEQPGSLISVCRSDYEVSDFLGVIEVDGYKGLTSLDASCLRAGAESSAKDQRFELINAVNAGKHVELSVTANTFRQRNKPNRRGLRLEPSKLESRAPTWKNLPYLTDHNTWIMTSSKGTILSSKAVQESTNVAAFEQVLHAVTPDAVKGILNGTFRRFSIGWFPVGPVLCTVHGCDVRMSDSCSCWPLSEVTAVDGSKKIAEYLFTDFEGKETSTVVIPAVSDTSISDIRAQLSAELGIPATKHRTPPPQKPTPTKENTMRFARLAAFLGMTAFEEADEPAALAAVEALQRRATTAEARAVTAETSLSAVRTQLTNAESALTTLTAAQVGERITAVLAQGYAAGKLRPTRDKEGKVTEGPIEKFLRGLGASGGITVLEAQLAAMPVIVPVGQRLQAFEAGDPERSTIGVEDELTADNPYIVNAAAQLGLKPADMIAFATGHVAIGGQ